MVAMLHTVPHGSIDGGTHSSSANRKSFSKPPGAARGLNVPLTVPHEQLRAAVSECGEARRVVGRRGPRPHGRDRLVEERVEALVAQRAVVPARIVLYPVLALPVGDGEERCAGKHGEGGPSRQRLLIVRMEYQSGAKMAQTRQEALGELPGRHLNISVATQFRYTLTCFTY